MVKARKNKAPATAAVAAERSPAAAAEGSPAVAAEGSQAAAAKTPPVGKPVPSSSNLTPSKKIKKDKKKKKPQGSNGKNKREGGSDAVTVVPTGGAPAAAAAAAADALAGNSKIEQKVVEKSSGFIFMCSSKTKAECYRHRLFGMPKGKAAFVERIKPGARLFLYDVDLKLMYGVYRAASQGGMNLVPGAFNGAFPAQVKFKIDKDCLPLPESAFKQAILENYDSKNKFQPDLNSKQVHKLMAMFQPITAAPQPTPPNFVDDRRVPAPAHFPPHAEYRAEQVPRAYLPPPDDPYRSSALQAPSHLPPPEVPYRSYAHPAPSHLPPPEDPYRLSAYQAPSQLPPPEDPYRSRRHLAPVHLPSLEEKYLGRALALAPDTRYISAHPPPTANDPYYPEDRYARAPLSVAQATDPYYRPSSGYIYQQVEAARAYYPENPIPSERLGYRVLSDTIGDPTAPKERDYPSLLRAEADVHPRATRVDEPHVGSTSAYERLPPSYLVQHYDPPVYVQGYTTTVQRQPSGTVPVSSRYSFAGAAPAPQ